MYQWLSCAQSPRWALPRIVLIKASMFCPSEDIFAMTPAEWQGTGLLLYALRLLCMEMESCRDICTLCCQAPPVGKVGQLSAAVPWYLSTSPLPIICDLFTQMKLAKSLCSCGLRLSLVSVLATAVSKLWNAYPMPLPQDSSSGLCIHSKGPGMLVNPHWYFS